MYNALSSVIGGGRGAQQEHLALRDVVPHVAACGPHQRSSKILFVSQKRLFQQYLPTADSYLLQSPTRASAPRSEAHLQIGRSQLSEAEPQSDRGSDVVALEKAGGQSAIHLREHDPGIEIPLWCKPP